MTLRPTGGLKNENTDVSVSVTANKGPEERCATLNVVSGGVTVKSVTLTQMPVLSATPSMSAFTFGGQESTANCTITSNTDWVLESNDSWLTASPGHGASGQTVVAITAAANAADADRTGKLTLKCGNAQSEITVFQLSGTIEAPEGYTLVWNDEFSQGDTPSNDWVLENWPAGHVNNELQTYTDKTIDGKRTAEVKDGLLYINLFKGSDGKVYSARMNARPRTGWLYGYFEARICLPAGKGTWPAFWLMPKNEDWGANPWPKCGEIDIMEEWGANPDVVSSSLHTEKYNHTKGTHITQNPY